MQSIINKGYFIIMKKQGLIYFFMLLYMTSFPTLFVNKTVTTLIINI